MESPGKRLKEVRLKKGLSLEEAHKKTKINLNILKAIEEDNLANLSPVYLKGFLKIYCNFLGVDPKDYMPGYRQAPQQAAPPPQRNFAAQTAKGQPARVGYSAQVPKPAPFKEKPGSSLRAASSKLASLSPEWKRRILYAVIAVIALIFLSIVVNMIKSAVARKRAQPRQARVVVPVAPKAQPPKPQSQASSAVTPEPAGIRLGIHAKDDCWVQLKIDGKAVFQSILKKGRFEVWQAKNRIDLSLGNVGNVELELNGKMLLPLGRRGQSLKNIVITKEGLKVER